MLMLEVLGRPPEHIKEGLKMLVDKMATEPNVKILSRQENEPIPVEDTKDLFTTFAEIELETDSLLTLFGLLFAYMPSHVEIISPEKLTLENRDLSDFATKLMQRLHEYDAVTKNALTEREFVINKLKEVAPHLFEKKEDQDNKK